MLPALYLLTFGGVNDLFWSLLAIFFQSPASRTYLLYVISFVISLAVLHRLLPIIFNTSTQPTPNQGPVFLPVKVHHRRFIPKSHSFTAPYLMCLIPVDWQGNASGMLSVGPDAVVATESSGVWQWLAGGRRALWHVDPTEHLLPGRPGMTLRQKLNVYLQSQNINPALYPHTYLVTAPKFLSIGFVPNSFWYLYTANGTHALTIVEAVAPTGNRRIYSIHRTPGTSPSSTFQKTFGKDLFISPFSPGIGRYTMRAPAPASIPFSEKAGDIQKAFEVTLGLLDTANRSEFVAYVASSGPAINPMTCSLFQCLLLIVGWWWTGWAVLPRTLVEGFTLAFRKGIKTLPEPALGSESIAREMTSEEKKMEGVWRIVLREAVEQTEGVEIRYVAAGARMNNGDAEMVFGETMTSQVSNKVDMIHLRPLTPEFYTRVAQYGSSKGLFQALLAEEAYGTLAQLSEDDKQVLSKVFPLEKQIRTPIIASNHSNDWTDSFLFNFIRQYALSLANSSLSPQKLAYERWIDSSKDALLRREFRNIMCQSALAELLGVDVIALCQSLPFRLMASWMLAGLLLKT